jgi:hypothetical protein
MTVHEPKTHADIEALPLSATYNRLRQEITQLDVDVLGTDQVLDHIVGDAL